MSTLEIKDLHASATARFDDQQLFYLRSRGVTEQEARRLVLHGFFHDLIRKVGVTSLEERLTATVEEELSKNVFRADHVAPVDQPSVPAEADV